MRSTCDGLPEGLRIGSSRRQCSPNAPFAKLEMLTAEQP
jgi:hypothetical protein